MKAADKTLAKRYARAYIALDGLAFDKQIAVEARNKIAELEKVWSTAGQFRRFLLHPLIGCENKKEILAKLLPPELLASRAGEFVRLLIKEHRFQLLDKVLEDCMKLYTAFTGVVRAEVVSRYPMTYEEVFHVEKVISAAFGKKALIAHIMSERVIGGLEIKINDLLIDATLKGRLEKLKRSILAE